MFQSTFEKPIKVANSSQCLLSEYRICKGIVASFIFCSKFRPKITQLSDKMFGKFLKAKSGLNSFSVRRCF